MKEQKKGSPLGTLWSWGKAHHGKFVFSIILAILGVACQMIPYFCVVNVISKMFAGETAFSAYLPVCLVALTGYCGKVLFSNLSTVISHNAAYSTLRDLRERVERGVAKVGDAMEIVGIKPDRLSTTVTGLEMFRKSLDYAEAGDNIGALLRGVDRTQIERGQVLAKPGSVHPHKVFESQVYVLTKDEGGRHTPFFSNYRPQFYFRTTDVTGIITLPEGTEMCMPGDNVMMHVELLTPVAMEEGLRFAIREGGRTVGSGVVGKIIE